MHCTDSYEVLIFSPLKKYLVKATTAFSNSYEPRTPFKNLRQPIRVMHTGEE
jgi:hypothetical protein